MIISASYKTDIPAFYGEWFVKRLRAGFAGMVNSYSRAPYRISLDRADVDGFVFWTKNLRPFLKHLPEIRAFGAPAYVQFTINGYPKSLEAAVVDWRKSIDAAKRAHEALGESGVVWRYDTIIMSDSTDRDFHLANFEEIASALKGVTDEVVISFLQPYKKTLHNLNASARENSNPWWEPSVDEKRTLARELWQIAEGFGMRLTVCSQPDLITVQEPARCIDSVRLMKLSGGSFRAMTKGNRPGCECAESKDIGDYDTCPHGCVYCYAVRSQDLAIKRFRDHDPNSEFLYPVPAVVEKRELKQLRLDV